MTKPKSLSTKLLKKSKLVSWKDAVPLSVFKLEKDSRAGVIVNKNNSPKLFIFDTFALLDLLSHIDDSLADKLSHKEYHSKKVNPSGWLIDEIESKLPVKPEYVASLKKAVAEAEEKGWISFDEIQAEIGP